MDENWNHVEVIAELTEILYNYEHGNGYYHRGWVTDGVDGLESPYTAEEFRNAGMLVLEFAEPVEDENGEAVIIQVIWQGDAQTPEGWNWTQVDYEIPLRTIVAGVDLSACFPDYDEFTQCEYLKIIIGSWVELEALGVKRAYLAPIGFKPYIPITGISIEFE